MNGVIEVEKIKLPVMTINHDLNKYNQVIMFPEKLKRVNERLKQLPFPPQFYLDGFSKTQQEHGIEVNGVLHSMDANKNIFFLLEIDGPYEIDYNIHTTAETLQQLVKAFLDKPIKVHIRPEINANNVFQYELIEVKVD